MLNGTLIFLDLPNSIIKTDSGFWSSFPCFVNKKKNPCSIFVFFFIWPEQAWIFHYSVVCLRNVTIILCKLSWLHSSVNILMFVLTYHMSFKKAEDCFPKLWTCIEKKTLISVCKQRVCILYLKPFSQKPGTGGVFWFWFWIMKGSLWEIK